MYILSIYIGRAYCTFLCSIPSLSCWESLCSRTDFWHSLLTFWSIISLWARVIVVVTITFCIHVNGDVNFDKHVHEKSFQPSGVQFQLE